MPVTLQEVVSQLDREEPDYVQAAALGPEALPHLRQLIQEDDLGLASKAAYLAGAINGDESPDVLALAARHTDPVVRVAAAASSRNLTRVTTSLATTFLDDPDPGVRKLVLKALEAHHPQGVRAKVEDIMRNDPEIKLREQAGRIIDSLK
jgi:hypothetical protein